MAVSRLALPKRLSTRTDCGLLLLPYACDEGFRDTKATHYGLDLANDRRIQAERRANLLLIAALILFALWIVGIHLKGTEIERHIKVNSGAKSPYSVLFLARIACRYVSFELPVQYWLLAQDGLVRYFTTLEEG